MLVFLIAMDKEAQPVIGQMAVKSDEVHFDKRIVTGKLFGHDVGVVVCGVGKVNAACGTQYAIDKLNATAIINLGVAGGLNAKLKIGELYCIAAVVQYDFDLAQLNGTKIGTLDECKDNYLPLSVNYNFNSEVKNLATGDRFNDSKEDFLLLTNTLNADIRDMECGAIAQVCMHSKVPCWSFKIISDLAGSGSTTEQYLNNLTVCFNTIEKELRNVLDGIKGIEF